MADPVDSIRVERRNRPGTKAAVNKIKGISGSKLIEINIVDILISRTITAGLKSHLKKWIPLLLFSNTYSSLSEKIFHLSVTY